MRNNFLIALTTTLFLTALSFVYIKTVNAATPIPISWVKGIGGTLSSDIGNDIDVASSGNVYTAGQFKGTTIDFDDDNDISGDTLTNPDGLNTQAYIAKYDNSGVFQWVKRLDGTVSVTYDVYVDSTENVYAVGYFQGTVDFDEDNVVSGDTHSTVGADNDLFIAKYNSSGVLQWVNAIGGSSADRAHGITIDSSDNVIVTGYFQGTADFDENNVVSGDTPTSAGSADIFIAKYNSSGVLQWVNALGDSSSQIGYAVSYDSSDNVYAVGNFSGTVDFDENNVVSGDTPTSAGGSDIYLAKYDSSGNLQWLKALGDTGNDNYLGVVVENSGVVSVAGSFAGTVDFDEDNVVSGDTHTASGSTDGIIAQYDTNGVIQWSEGLGSGSFEAFQDVATDASANLYVTGYFNGTTDFEEDSIEDNDTQTSAGSTDIFFAKYDNTGLFQWIKDSGESQADSGLGIAVDDNENVYGTGVVRDIVDFDQDYDISGDTKGSTGSDQDIFILKYGEAAVPLGEQMRIVLRDNENAGASSDVEVWFDTLTVNTNSSILVSYESNFTGGSSITTNDITLICDTDGIDPLSGTTMTGATVVTSQNGFLEIDTGASSCSEYVVIDIHGDGGNSLTNPTTPGNYSWSIAIDNGGDNSIDGQGATLAYVQDENDITITANVPPVLDMELYETNVDTLLNGTGANTCELGVLSINTVSTCTYDIGTGTNNPAGVSVYIQSDGELRDGSGNTIDACSGINCDSLGGAGVDVGEEEYGIYISELGSSEYTAGGSFGIQHQAVPTTETLFASSSTTGSGTTTGSVAQRLEVTHAVGISTATTQGSYSHIVTYTAFTN